MTIPEIVALEREFLIPTEIAGIVGMNAQTIRVAARQRPELLGFPVVVTGTRTRIPRVPFLRFLGVEI